MLSESQLKELQKIQELKKQVKNSLENAPKGSMRCMMSKGKYPQYYHVIKGEEKLYKYGKYLGKTEQEIIKRLAQKEYDLKIMKVLDKQEAALMRFEASYPKETLHQVFENLPEAKKILVDSYTSSDEEFIRAWKRKYDGIKNTYPIFDNFITERGEAVRSKTEKIIADKLHYEQIIYLYEAPLYLDGGELVYPDFTLLNERSRETFYWEHFGAMDNPDYCRKALEKIALYERNGIYPGEHLIMTMESSMRPIDTEQIEIQINRFLK